MLIQHFFLQKIDVIERKFTAVQNISAWKPLAFVIQNSKHCLALVEHELRDAVLDKHRVNIWGIETN